MDNETPQPSPAKTPTEEPIYSEDAYRFAQLAAPFVAAGKSREDALLQSFLLLGDAQRDADMLLHDIKGVRVGLKYRSDLKKKKIRYVHALAESLKLKSIHHLKN